MSVLRLLGDLLQQPLVCLLLSLYCFNTIYSFCKQAVNTGAGHNKKAVINNWNQQLWWLAKPLIFSLLYAPVQIMHLQNYVPVIMCGTPPFFTEAVDCKVSVTHIFPSSLELAHYLMLSEHFLHWKLPKFHINKGVLVLMKPKTLTVLLIQRCGYLEKEMSFCCSARFSGELLQSWVPDMHCSCEAWN